MFDLPPELPPELPVESAIEDRCINFNVQHFGIPKVALKAIRRVENGQVCTFSENTNGTYDLGPMQINSIHIPDIQAYYKDIDVTDIACKPCLNITIGSWLLSKRLKEVDGNLWLAVGNYHSKTPNVRQRYLKKIEMALKSLEKEQG